MEQKIADNICKCPYCFKPFSTEAVQFKAMTVYTQQDLEEFTEEEMEGKQAYLESDDERYRSFWNDYPGSDPGFQYEGFPTLLSKKIDAGREFSYPVARTCDRDPEGFLYQAVDDEGRTTKVRICPHCHNPLPFEYGKYPVKYIAVVGITSSGKTIYLAQLLAKIKEVLARADLTVIGTHEEVDAFVRNNRIRKGVPLPGGNATNLLTLPMPLNVIHNRDNKKYTLVFYDIAGENCVKPELMSKFGSFIEYASGILMIVDPVQFSELFDIPEEYLEENRNETNPDEDPPRPEEVLEAMYNAFGAVSSVNGKCKTPLAAALSKSDILKDCLDHNLNMFQEINYEAYESFGFPYEEYRNIDTEIKVLLKDKKKRTMQGTLFANQLTQCFPNHGYFAFTTLNVKAVKKKQGEVTYSVLEEDPETRRIEEPVFWLLNQMDVIDKAKKKQQENGGKRGLFGFGR